MGQLTIVYWRDIPAQVIARVGRTTAKRELPARFADAIDRAAMRAGLSGADGYLEAWRRGAATACGDDLEAAADGAVGDLDAGYPLARLKQLIEAAGVDAPPGDPATG